MRIFGRFLYALLAVGFFLLAFTYSIDQTANKFYSEVFGASLTDANSDMPDFYYFYTSIPDYHQATPMISVDIEGYQVRGYEVATAKINNENKLEIEEYLYWIVYSEAEDLSLLSHLDLIESDNQITLIIPLSRFKHLNLLNGINENGTVYISKNLFIDNEFDKIKLIDKNDVVLGENDVEIKSSNFIIKENLELFYQTYNRIPEQEDLELLQSDDIGIRLIHINEEQMLDSGIMLKAMLVYFAALIITTYLIFFKKRKYE